MEYHLSLLFMFVELDDIVEGSSGRPRGSMSRTAGDTAKMAGARCRRLTSASPVRHIIKRCSLLVTAPHYHNAKCVRSGRVGADSPPRAYYKF